jgi:anthranilate synthase component II
MKSAMKLLMIDNYDSFTYNLVQYFGELGADVVTVRNDAYSVDDALTGRMPGLDGQTPKAIVVSPGPCSPTEAGISVELIRAVAALKNPMPLLGVCLGHQSIGQAFGGKVVRAQTIMHGKTSQLSHTNQSVFKGLPNPFTVIRYHSLAIERQSLPASLQVTAQTDDGEIMGVMHKTLPIHGVQFHPESILTEHGHALLKNFLDLVPA